MTNSCPTKFPVISRVPCRLATICKIPAFWRLGMLALLVTTMMLTTTSLGQNLAVNPGFESGSTASWFGFGSPTISTETAVVHSGSYAGMVTNRTATYMGIAQSFLGVLQTNQTYIVSVWLQLVTGPSQTVQVTAQKIDGSGTTYAAITSGAVSAG